MIWNELYQKSFFQDVKIHGFGDIHFKMHDLVHDLAQSISEQECICLEEINLTDLQRNTHHIGFSYAGQTPFNKKAYGKVESLRTLYQLDILREGISSWFSTSLRVLQTNSFELSLLRNLTHLRYLELHYLDIEILPDSIYNLRKLEILKLIKLHRLHSLPKHLMRLQNLRHLVIEGCDSLSHMLPNIHKLSHLRTLSINIVKTETGHSLAELHALNLGGQLSIKGLQIVGSSFEAQEANLRGKEDLQELSLYWDKHDETKSHATDAAQVLEALQSHPNLKALRISSYEGLHWPSWMRNNSILNNLVSLKLFSCKIIQQLPPLGKLHSLKILEIYFMDYVQYVDVDECYDGVEVRAFPCLERLIVYRLRNLEGLLKIETRETFPGLSHLHVQNCPKLLLSFLPWVKDLHVWEGNNELLRSISCLNNLDSLVLEHSEDVTSFPEGMMNNLTGFKTLEIRSFPKLKQLPYEITKLNALKSVTIVGCGELESLPEEDLEGLHSLRTLEIRWCTGLRYLPDCVRHLTSLEALTINYCPTLHKGCKERSGLAQDSSHSKSNFDWSRR